MQAKLATQSLGFEPLATHTDQMRNVNALSVFWIKASAGGMNVNVQLQKCEVVVLHICSFVGRFYSCMTNKNI